MKFNIINILLNYGGDNMYDFMYHIKFKKRNEKLDIKIFLSLEDLFTPVYVRTYDATILEDKEAFLKVYQEIDEYLIHKFVAISDEDFRLLYHTLISFDIELPQILTVNHEYDEDLDQYDRILTPKDLVFLTFVDGKAVDDKRFETWENDNDLDTEYLKEAMLNRKLISTDNYYYNMSKAKRELLLEVADAYGINNRGDNNDLVAKLKIDLPEEYVKKHFSGTHLTLTEKGKKLIGKSKKIIDFDRSFFRYVNKLPLEEFHLLSIKKGDYDFNGIGRLLMVNSPIEGVEYFDWNSIKILEQKELEVKKEYEGLPLKEENFLEYVNKISESNEEPIAVAQEEEEEEIKQEIKKEEVIPPYKEKIPFYLRNQEDKIKSIKPEIDDDNEKTNDEIYIEQNPKISKQLETYREKREIYEKTKKGKHKEKVSVYKPKSKHIILKWLFYFIIFIMCCLGVLYIIETMNIVKLPFSLKEIFQSFKDTLYEYKRKIFDFIDYVKAYK